MSPPARSQRSAPGGIDRAERSDNGVDPARDKTADGVSDGSSGALVSHPRAFVENGAADAEIEVRDFRCVSNRRDGGVMLHAAAGRRRPRC